MRITFIKENRDAGTESISTCDTAAFITRIKSETKPGHVSALRTMLEYTSHGSGGTYGHIDKLPRICPATEYGRNREGERRMKRYNGIVLLEVGGLSGMSEAELVKEQAALLPQTYAAFAGSSGRSVKIWALFALPNGKLPQREEEISLFHAHAYRMAVQCYQPLLPFPVTLKEPSPADTFRMTLDETPYFAPDAVPFCLEQPVTMPGERTFNQRKLAENNPLKRHPRRRSRPAGNDALPTAGRRTDGAHRTAQSLPRVSGIRQEIRADSRTGHDAETERVHGTPLRIPVQPADG